MPIFQIPNNRSIEIKEDGTELNKITFTGNAIGDGDNCLRIYKNDIEHLFRLHPNLDGLMALHATYNDPNDPDYQMTGVAFVPFTEQGTGAQANLDTYTYFIAACPPWAKTKSYENEFSDSNTPSDFYNKKFRGLNAEGLID